MFRRLLISLLLVSIGVVHAVESVRVVALFSNRAMVEVDGQRHFLRVGSRSPEGVLLVSANTREAVLEVDGQRDTYTLNSHYGGSYAQPELREVRIPRSNNGAFLTVGSINGRPTTMLVDTGATSVAMSEVEAKRLGIRYRVDGEKIGVRTASGTASAYAVTFDRVKVGEIEQQQVAGVVITGTSPHQVLLGMSFLSRVDMDNQGNVLLLRSKF